MSGRPRYREYSFVTHTRGEGNLCIADAVVIILEGIFAIYYHDLLNFPTEDICGYRC